MIFRFALSLTLAGCFGATVQAASWEQVITVGGLGREVFIPDTSRPVKAVLISNWKDPNASGRPDILYPSEDMRALGRKWNMMQMHWLGRHETDASLTTEYNALVTTLNQVATLLGKPEIAVTPIFIQGLSGTANNAATMAKKDTTGRIAGVIQHHFSFQSAPDGVPCLYVVGGLDNTVYNDITLQQQLDRVAPRAANGDPVTLYLEPGQFHDTAALDQKFPALWMDEIITLRFPSSIPTTSFRLPSWKNYHAWIGCTDASSDSAMPWNRGMRGINNYIQAHPYSGGRPYIWLPSQRVAEAWKIFMDTGVFPTSGTSVTLTAPAAGTEYISGASVSASASASATSGSITKVEFFDNGALVATDSDSAGGWTASWAISSAAVHALHARATNSNGEQASSSPVNVNVRRPADNPGSTVPGVSYGYYENAAINGELPDFATLTPLRSGSATSFDLAAAGPRADNFAYRFTGFITVATAGSYTFFTSSDDGSKLYIGADQVVDNGGPPHGDQERSGTVSLATGPHAITVTYAEGTGSSTLTVQWQGPGITKVTIPASALQRVASGDTTPPAQPPRPTASSTTSATPTLSGTAEAGATVRVYDGGPAGTVIATTTANGSGVWSVTVSTLSQGVHSLTVTATDAAGNASPHSLGVAITAPGGNDTSPPSAPTISPLPSGGNTATPTLYGTTEPGATVRVYDAGVLIATTIAHGTGEWSVTLPTLNAGSHALTVTSTDASGNVSPSTPMTVSSPGGSTASSSSDDNGGSCGLGAISAAMMMMFLLGLRLRQRC